MLSKNCYSCW